jgi:tetratricopeptide (TPR) repeat protein
VKQSESNGHAINRRGLEHLIIAEAGVVIPEARACSTLAAVAALSAVFLLLGSTVSGAGFRLPAPGDYQQGAGQNPNAHAKPTGDSQQQGQPKPPDTPPEPSSPGEVAYEAAKDVEVGKFYMDKGDVDAAIGRFENAAKLKSNFAEPHFLLGKCYDKKGVRREALRHYEEYLKIAPNGPDAKKAEIRVKKLKSEQVKASEEN